MPELGESLSEREVDVLERLAEGAANKEIATTLHISANTVKVHLRNIYTKLGATSRTEAVRIAMEQGLLTLPNVENESATTVADPPDSDPLPASETPTAVSHAVAPGPLRRATRWRTAGLFLFALLALIVVGLVGWQGLSGRFTIALNPTEAPFVDATLGNNWLASRPMPTATSGMAAAAVGLRIYQIGGENAVGVTNAVTYYDTVSRQWQFGAAKPTAVTDATAAVLFGEIYVPGGRLADGTPTAVVEAYSPTNDAWRAVAALPQAVAGGLTLSDGSFLYVIGGQGANDYLDTVYRYDSGEDEWERLPPMSTARAFAAGAAVQGQLYVVGGQNDNEALRQCTAFDPAAQTWQTCALLPAPRSGAGAITLVNKLFVFGGVAENETAAGETAVGVLYDPEQDGWEAIDWPLPAETAVGWRKLGVTLVETRIYLFGGQRDGAVLGENYIYNPLAFRTYLPAASSEGN